MAGRTGALAPFGGRYVAEALWEPLEDVRRLIAAALADEAVLTSFERALDQRLGRPTPLTPLSRMSAGGATIWLKREDLCQGDTFCANLATLQALIAAHAGKRQLIAESATGAFGEALGMVAAPLGLGVQVFMGREDAQAERARVARMKLLGVQVVLHDAPHRGRGVAQAEAMRAWLARPADAFYCTNLLASPDPYPELIERALSVLGAELRVQLARMGHLPARVVAPVGSGAFAAGVFSELVAHPLPGVELVGVRASGEETPQAEEPLERVLGEWGVHQGTSSRVLVDAEGQPQLPSTRAVGLAASVVGPQHARWAERGQVRYVRTSDASAGAAALRLAREEGLIINIESAHALAWAIDEARALPEDAHVIVAITGQGDPARLGALA